MLVRFEDDADVEYRKTGRRYEAQVPGLGGDFFDEVDAAIRQILAFPRSGSPVPRLPNRVHVRRLAVRRFPYSVVYLEPGDELWILAIAHDRRKPRYWRGRLK